MITGPPPKFHGTRDILEIERLVELGATRVEYREGNGTSWTVMLDPEGNEFCIG
jgi:hypothetical protein